MSAVANQIPIIKVGSHFFNADAFAFSADLQAPILGVIEKQALVNLPADGGYDFKLAEPKRIDGIVSHEGGYAQVVGRTDASGTAITAATAVLEGLNILDILTVDRLVAQITTEHAANSSVPSVSFLGTRFENLRIGGQEIEIEPYHDILGSKPDNDESYLNDGGVLSRIAQQYSKIRSMVGLPKWASDQFKWDPAETQRQQVKCSLVKSVAGAPGKSFGHVIEVPFFGTIYLGELTVTRVVKAAPTDPASAGPRLEMSTTDSSGDGSSSSGSGSSSGSNGYQLTVTMLNANLKGSTCGTVTAGQTDPNGSSKPPNG